MRRLILKMLLRKKGTTVAVIAIALLIALLAATNSLLNNLTAQTGSLSQLANTGQTYLVMSRNAAAPFDGQTASALTERIRGDSDLAYASAQLVTQATLIGSGQNFTVNVHGVDNVTAYLNFKGASLNGTVSKTQTQVNIGVVLSKIAVINPNDTIKLEINNQPLTLKVVGITETGTQSDSEILLPLKNLQTYTQTVSVSQIELSFKNQANKTQTLNQIAQTLPQGTVVVQIQQLVAFTEDINNQTTTFIDVWSVAIYIIVVAASYTMATRLVNEAHYELDMLKNLGAKNKTTLSLIVTHTLLVAVAGAVIGVALGIVGVQVAATGLRWVWGSFLLVPFLLPTQALQVLSFATLAAIIGSLSPAVGAVKASMRGAPM